MYLSNVKIVKTQIQNEFFIKNNDVIKNNERRVIYLQILEIEMFIDLFK